MAVERRRFLIYSGAALGALSVSACARTKKAPTRGVPRSTFNDRSTAEEVTEGIDLSGRFAVVTGCTSGIGFETMRVLALRGAHVAGTSRSLEKARAACESVKGLTTPLQLELADFDSVVECANAIHSINQPLDILICNAGYLGGSGERETINGIEKHFAINHLGHFVLVNRLLAPLRAARQGRVVIVSSRAAYTSAPAAGIEFDNLDGKQHYTDRRAYGHSKLANALFAVELAARLKSTGITANALNPGIVNTEIDRHMNRFMQAGFAVITALGVGKSIAAGAATSCYAASNPQLKATSGKFFEDCNAVTVGGGEHLHDTAMAAKLWRVSEQLTQPYLVSDTGLSRGINEASSKSGAANGYRA
jgi:NAD(P)-dependent dehydrogenase (short-subunit alcohol dehydrogenase family)